MEAQGRLTQPLVVGLVKPLVANRVVFPTVDTVDAIIREYQEPVGRMSARHMSARRA